MRLAVLPRRRGGFVWPSFDGLQRGWIKIRLRLARLANIGANTGALRGFLGVMAVGAGVILRLLHIAERGAESLWAAAYRAAKPVSRTFSAALVLGRTVRNHVAEYAYSVENRRRSRLTSVMLLLTVTVLILSFSYFGLGLQVKLDGQVIGYVTSKDQIESLVSEVEQRAAEYLGTPYSLSPNITYSLRYMDSSRPVDTEALKEKLFSEIDDVSRQYVLTVDGTVIGANSSRTAIEMMLHRLIRSRLGADENVKADFVENIQIEERSVSNSQIRTVAQMEDILSSNKQEIQTYTVADGDTVSGIAVNHGVSIAEIKSLNPGLNVDRIHIGDKIQLSAAVPYLSLRKTVTEEYDAPIPYETTIEKDDSMYVNKSYIKVAGVEGKAHVTADVVYVNNQEESRTVLTYEVLQAPSTAVKVVGTKALPAKAATGSFVKPSNGYFSSGFGYRPRFGDYHTGVDFAGSVGTNIWAADGGVVIYAGWKGNYGYCVMINHDDNGYVTLYGHCSKLLVTVGQRVAKYEVIAKVGSTGRSTGPHVHFEIRKNGTPVNPLKYISK